MTTPWPDGGAYRALVVSRLRSQLSYRASFGLDLAVSIAIGAFEFAEIYVIFASVDVLGGLGVDAALLVFALSNLGFSFAGVLVGGLDEVPQLIRLGTIDALLLRPLPVLAQLVVQDVALRRLGRAVFAAVVLAVALPRLPVQWSPPHVALLVAAVASATAIFSALFVVAGAVQFFLVSGAEFTNAFVYGSSYAAQNSAALLPLPARVFFSFVVPAAFTGYLPAVTLLGLPAPGGLTGMMGWLAPVVAVVAWGVALLAWRSGLRHYTGAGG